MEPPGPSRSRTADAARVAIPLLIVFAAPSSLVVERDRPSQFPILGNGPPGTFVLFPGRLRVSLPTDQVVSADDTGGYAKVGFGGMRFTGMASGRLVFVRERDLYPVEPALARSQPHDAAGAPVGRIGLRIRSTPVARRPSRAITRPA